jgi:hypothetical protein
MQVAPVSPKHKSVLIDACSVLKEPSPSNKEDIELDELVNPPKPKLVAAFVPVLPAFELCPPWVLKPHPDNATAIPETEIIFANRTLKNTFDVFIFHPT